MLCYSFALSLISLMLFPATPLIEEQPKHYILSPGPTIDSSKEIILRCKARAWPLPTFQWYRNSKKIPGATKPELKLVLRSTADDVKRHYRCVKCSMVSKDVPMNAFHVRCRNCNTVFAFNEVICAVFSISICLKLVILWQTIDYDQLIIKLKAEELTISTERERLAGMLQRVKAQIDSGIVMDNTQLAFADDYTNRYCSAFNLG